AQDPRIKWPGGLIIGTDGNLHFFSNQLNRSGIFNSGKDLTQPPFYLFKVKPLPIPRFSFK
ncbi:MAG: gluconolaconase, partial [Verrucomicrobiota bacterium]